MQTMLIDGNHMLHRILHLEAFTSLQTSEGMKTGGIFGALVTIRKELEQFPTISKCCVVWDDKRSLRRKALLPGYKDRVPKDEEDAALYKNKQKFFNDQKVRLALALPRLGIRQLQVPDKEADDVLYQACQRHPDHFLVVTEDRDLLQIVDQKSSVHRPIADEHITHLNFSEHTSCPTTLFLLKKAIAGDKSDCIPGITGVGVKTVTKFLGSMTSKLTGRAAVPVTHEELNHFALAVARELREIPGPDKGRFGKIAEAGGVISLNLNVMDLAAEPFSSEDYALIDTALLGESSGFQEALVLQMFKILEFKKSIRSWSVWSSPFRRLR